MTAAVERVGRTPALTAALLAWGLVVLQVLAFPDAEAIGVIVIVLFVAYCFLRPANGTDVFFTFCAPGSLGWIVHELVGISHVWGLLILPFVLFHLYEIDNPDQAQDDETPSS